MVSAEAEQQLTCLTMQGTIRTKQRLNHVNVRVNMSRDELDVLETKMNKCHVCTVNQGVHILILSLLSAPFVLLVTCLYSFYMGTLTWYNVFSYMAEHRKLLKRLAITPCLVVIYPVFIVIVSVVLALYGAFVQVSWRYSNWIKRVTDLEKGFYGWICSLCKLEDCCPYQVVVLVNVRDSSSSAAQTEL